LAGAISTGWTGTVMEWPVKVCREMFKIWIMDDTVSQAGLQCQKRFVLVD